jgi:preprotein translocase subunit SecG
MQALLVVLELFVSVALIIVILLQKSEGGALGMGGGGSGLGGLFSPRGAGDALTRATTILGAIFFLTCIVLNVFALRGRDEKSILDTNTSAPAHSAPATPSQAPAVPAPH